MSDFNIDLLALARESRGYTQTELSQLLEVEQGTISKIENGRLGVNDNLIESISQVLDYPKNFFFDEDKVIRVEGHYRKKISLPIKQLKEYKSKMTLAERQINKLSDAIELPNPNIPSWDLETEGSIQDAAAYVREYWKIPRGRIEDLAKVIEDNGIIIVPLDLGDMDALSTFSAKYHLPILYINTRRPADRIRFNLAHELCHYICHFGKKIPSDKEDRDIEKEANTFASELLMPAKEISNQLTNLNIEKLAELKRYWKASMQSILYKAKDLGLITPNQSHYLWKQMGYLGYRKKEPITISHDKPTLLTEIIQTYIDDLGYSKEELADLLQLNIEDLNVIYFGERPKTKSRFGVIRNKTA